MVPYIAANNREWPHISPGPLRSLKHNMLHWQSIILNIHLVCWHNMHLFKSSSCQKQELGRWGGIQAVLQMKVPQHKHISGAFAQLVSKASEIICRIVA